MSYPRCIARSSALKASLLAAMLLIILPSLAYAATEVYSGLDSSGMQYSFQDKLVMDSNGKLHLVFEDDGEDIQYAVSSNNGTTWLSSEILTGTTYTHPSLAIDSNNGLHLVFEDTSQNDIQYVNSSDQSIWSMPVTIASTNNLNEPSIAIGPNNELRVCYIDETGDDLMYIGSSDGGKTWTGTEVDANDIDRCDIEVDGNGVIHVLGQSDGTDDVYHYNSSDGSNWTKTTIHDGSNDVNPVISIGANDEIFVAWADTSANSRIWFANSSNGLGWSVKSIQVNVTSTLNDVLYADIVVDYNNYIHIFYDYDNNSADYTIGYINSTNKGLSWSAPRIIETARTNPTSEDAMYINVRGSKFPVSNRITDKIDYVFQDSYSTDIVAYNSRTIPAPLIPPKVVLNSPANGVYINTSVIDFNFTATDADGIANCTLYGDFTGSWKANKTITGLTSELQANITINVGQGTFIWNVLCFDSNSETRGAFNTSNYTIYVGLSQPSITLYSPINYLNITSGSVDFNFSAVDSVSSSLNCSLHVNSQLLGNNASTLNNTATIFTVPSFSEGIYFWNITCFNQARNSNISLTRKFTVDSSAPSTSIALSPSTAAGQDPGALIQVTVNATDYLAVSSVIFQYIAYNETEWTNDSMNYNAGTGLWQDASFTPHSQGTWYYRTWSQDSLGNSGFSSAENISIDYDWTWTRTPGTFGTASALLGENASLGTLTITNTGDYEQEFDLSSNWQNAGVEKVYYNESEPFNLSAGQTKRLDVKAKVSSTERSDDIIITVDATDANAVPSSETITATLVAYTAGPYLYVKIVGYDSSVKQEDNGITYSAYLRNLGNETATNAYFYWILPPGWETGDELNISVSNLGIGEEELYDITVDIASNAPIGTQNLTVGSYCDEGKTGSDVIEILVGESGSGTEEPSPPAPSTVPGLGGGSGVGGSGEYSESRYFLEVIRGQKSEFPITITNIYPNSTLENVTISIEGFFTQYISLSPAVLNDIKFNQSKAFILTIDAPAYLEFANYTLRSTITGKIVYSDRTKTLTDRRTLALYVQELDKSEVSKLVEQASQDLETMRITGFSVLKSSALLEAAKAALAAKDNSKARDLSLELSGIKATAFATYEALDQLHFGIAKAESKGLSIPDTKDLYNLALVAFKREDYATAQQRARDANFSLALETKGKVNFIWLVANYWWAIAFVTIMLYGLSIVSYKKTKKIFIAKRLGALNNEELTIHKLMRSAQTKAFKTRGLSSQQYDNLVKVYEKRLSKIRQLRTKLRHSRTFMMNKQEDLESLESEREEIINLIQQTQVKYLEKGKMSRDAYQRESRRLNSRLAEVEDERTTVATLLARKVSEKNKKHKTNRKRKTAKTAALKTRPRTKRRVIKK